VSFEPASMTETDLPAEPPSRLRVRGAMLSHPGLARSSNEDSVIYSVPEEGSAEAALGVLALIADGMGGHAHGEVASQMATQTVHYLFYRRGPPVPAALAEGFAAANFAIYERSQTDSACSGMGTTCTAVAVRDDQIWLGHVGDSRAYLIRDGEIRPISKDDSLAAEMVRQGKLTEAEAQDFPDRHVLLRALGIAPQVEPTIWQEALPARDGDIVVLCSDGLTDVVKDETIQQTAAVMPPYEACEALIQHAHNAGGPDNVSVGVLVIGAAASEANRGDRATLEVVGGPQT
jgi:PPM family protein phosphatase